jgi:outer membrane immunogenic protein
MEKGIHMRRFIAAALASTALAVPAMAADLAPYVKSPVVVPWTWTGVYFGGDVGGAWSDNTSTWSPLPSPAAFGANSISGNTGGSAFAGGFYAGYNYQFSPAFVVGIEGDWTGMRATGAYNQAWTSSAGGGIIPGTSTAMNSEVEWAATLRGRLGYLIWPNLMLYGTGGGAWGKIQYEGSANNGVAYSAGAQFNNTSSGWVAGGGLEWAPFTGFGLLFRVEYLYYDFASSQSALATANGFPAFPSGFAWTAPKMSVARFGMSYKF